MNIETVVKGGRVVTPAMDAVTDIGIADGRVVAMGPDLTAPEIIDASGKAVLPGGIDMHVHLSDSPLPTGQRMKWADDFVAGSRAAAAGGITTIGNMSYAETNEPLLDALRRHDAEASDDSVVDYLLHVVVADPTPEAIAEIGKMHLEGFNTIKLFLSRPYFEQHTEQYLEVLRQAGRSGVLPLIHCEDSAICLHLSGTLHAEGCSSAKYYGDSRPDFAEETAVVRALGLARAADCPIYIVHVSSKEGIEAIQRSRLRGWPVYAETRPLYLYQTDDVYSDEDGAKWVGRPPVRHDKDVTSMWSGLESGMIDTYCSDHAPWKLSEKLDPSLNVGNSFLAGHADLDTLLPQFWDHAIRRRGWSIQRFVEVASTNAARIFGLFPQKGTIAVGSDADLVIWDPELVRSIDSSTWQSNSDFSLYEGETFTGWPILTMVRGTVVYRDGKIVIESGHGRRAIAGTPARTGAY
ncbi:amidohydrolase family protein [Streptomyces sp. HGB0020]|uniref:amidohydrolase family protein n=1 Tax=Streptomyces sp. HGB0020 TaxID=1078086 RepID=UPI00034ECC62|nr:amidohydrolase family protein [Streptomyces sp. HGB0020]EPD69478.1 dihydropyrimidinase [Streptomyces sp. HGB0020]